ncbi:HlyC/CorC family transporter [Niveibacterium umoris]|uniref:HlyC/CorC family transporter n=1 Tax=Niveibacterium umoris TaxID=1193620 RepID=UPI0023EC57F6|nr:CNNM domain-containing protein [Niveibacterium umoris]
MVISGFFSLCETAMMATNRYRLQSSAAAGHRGAALALAILAQTDRFLGTVLLFNNLVNAAAATLVSVITIQLFGDNEWALGLGTLGVTFLILVFSEITPKVIGANYADRLAPNIAFVLGPLMRGTRWLVASLNVFVSALLRLARLERGGTEGPPRLSMQELRTLVLEAGHFIPSKHRTILLNLFELESITIEDVMTPRGKIEAVDLSLPLADIRERLATAYHTRLPAFVGDPNDVVGILHIRRMLNAVMDENLTVARLQELCSKPYFIPASTPVYSQLQFFQENQQRLGVVVDEYGEVLGLVTVEDIIEELIGKFTTSLQDESASLRWGEDGTVVIDGARTIRELNRALGLNFPTDGPKTLNGLLLEYLQDIPESGLSVKICGTPIEVVQTHDRRVRTARLFRTANPA